MRKENVRCPMCGTMNYDVDLDATDHPDQNGTADDVQPPTGPQKRPEQKCAGGGRLRQRQDEILA